MRLVVGYRSSKSSLDAKLQAHSKLFKVCIHFTNYSIKARPLRKHPHWMLCMGPVPTAVVQQLLFAFIRSPEKVHVSSLVSNAQHRAYIEEIIEEEEEEDVETEND